MSEKKVSNVDGLSNIMSGKGDIGDQDSYMRPSRPKSFTFETNRDLYRGTGIASAIIDRPVDRSIRVGWMYKGVDEAKIIETMKKIKFKQNIKKALKYNRIYGGAIIVFGLYDGGLFETPLNPNYSKGIDFMRVYHKGQIQKDSIVSDPKSIMYGLPEKYKIIAAGFNEYKVHHSRCIVLTGVDVDEETEIENEGWGDSIFVSTWDAISRYDDTLDTMKKIANNFVNIALEIDGLFSAIRAGTENEIKKRLAFFNATMHSMNISIHDKDEKISKISSDVSGLKDIFDAMINDLPTASGIPARVLFGKQIGGLNNEGKGETTDWEQFIEDFLDEKALPIIEKTVKLITPKPTEIKFNDVSTPSAKEKAEIYKLTSEADAINIVNQVLTPEECRKSHYEGEEFSVEITVDGNYDPLKFSQENVNSASSDPLLDKTV